RHRQNPDGAGEVQELPDARCVQHPLRIPDVLLHDRHPWIVAQQIPGVRDGNGFEVDIGDAGFRVVVVRDLVHVADGRYPGTEVEELVDALLDHEPHRPPQEGPVLPGPVASGRDDRELFFGGLPVHCQVRRAAEVVVVHPGCIGGAQLYLPAYVDHPGKQRIAVVCWHIAILPIVFVHYQHFGRSWKGGRTLRDRPCCAGCCARGNPLLPWQEHRERPSGPAQCFQWTEGNGWLPPGHSVARSARSSHQWKALPCC